jgi:3-isopropylmalate dehydratase small subunit
MDKFTQLEGVAAPLRVINVDTDMIIPKQYLKTLKRTGLAKGLFSEMRYKDDGSENPDFVLNKPAYRNAKILVADNNFGCGSSREHAPWALLDFGIRCVISTQFGRQCAARIQSEQVVQHRADHAGRLEGQSGAHSGLPHLVRPLQRRGPDARFSL